jgi:hypothetical protein
VEGPDVDGGGDEEDPVEDPEVQAGPEDMKRAVGSWGVRRVDLLEGELDQQGKIFSVPLKLWDEWG